MGIKSCGLALAMLLALPAGAWAHDHAVPDALLVTEQGSGEGRNYTATWARGSGRYCAVATTVGAYGWPGPPVEWVPGTEMAVRFDTRHKPTRVRAHAFLLGDATTETAIYGKVDVPHELRKVEVDGKTMWEAVLSPPPWPDLWLDVWARWNDQDGCHPQVAGWRFRAGLLPI